MMTLNDHFTSLSNEVAIKCSKYAQNVKRFSHLLEEEQEQEMEIEQEEEREQYRPQSATPLKNQLDEDVENLVILNVFKKDSKSFVPMIKALENSSLKNGLQVDAWNDHLFVTRDFTRTVSSNNEIDDYLRPPRWLCVLNIEDQDYVVILSDFEANCLYSYFSNSKAKLTMLMPRVKFEQRILLPKTEIPSDFMSQLFIFSGSMYFKTIEEQRCYVDLIGYSLSPRSDEEQNYYDSGLIHKNGFVSRENRNRIFKNAYLSKFEDDPRDLIVKLVDIRNYGVVPKSAHHLDIFQSAKKPVKEI
jgi:hypothetical protein